MICISLAGLGRRASDGGANIHLFNRQMYGNSLPGSPGSQETLATVRYLTNCHILSTGLEYLLLNLVSANIGFH